MCNTARGVCVECNVMADCGGERVCLANRCVTPTRCMSSRTCPGQVCSLRLGYCVDCEADVDCTGGQVCRGSVCVAPPRACRSSRECSEMGAVCDAARGVCVECVGDNDCPMDRYCGPEATCLRRVCAPNATRCTGLELISTCDARGTRWQEIECPVGQTCREGRCQPTICTARRVDCDPATGQRRQCNDDGGGYTAMPCAAGETCREGACVARTCTPGAATCPAGGSARVICNADGTSTRVEPCPAPAHATGRCGEGGACTFACDAGFGDCDMAAANGCEAGLDADVRSCGGCGRACPSGQSCERGACTAAPPPAPMALRFARYGVAVALGTDGRAYALGGMGSGVERLNESYDAAMNRWTTRAQIPWAAHLSGAVGLADGRVLLVGGYSSTGGPTEVVYAYTPSTDAWAAIASLPAPASRVAIARGNDGKVYVFGGQPNGTVASNITYAYDPTAGTWATLRPMPTGRMSAAAVTVPDGRIYVFGGSVVRPSETATTTVEVYDPRSNTWAPGPALPSPRAGMGAALGSDGRIYLAGGTSGGGFDESVATAVAFSPATGVYTPVASMGTSRYFFGMVALPDGRLLAVGGASGRTALASVEAYSIALDRWR